MREASSVAIARRKPVTVPWHLRRVLSLRDFETRARRKLPLSIFGYVSGGVERDASLTANRRDLDALAFVPRVLRDVSGRDQGLSLLGQDYRLPFAIAPMGFSALAAYDGDVVLARGRRRQAVSRSVRRPL